MLGDKVMVVGQVLSAPVNIASLDIMTGRILEKARRSQAAYVCVANVHMIVSAQKSPALLAIMNNAALVCSDGMPLVWELRRQGHKQAERVAGPDLTVKLCEQSQAEGIPVYFFGGSHETIEKLKDAVGTRFPNLHVAGYESPPVLPQCPEVDPKVVACIKASGAKIVFVGLGCPKQEFWMHAYSKELNAVLIGVGAAFEFLAGTKRRAPVWMQRAGLEWLFRLASEPGRLWKRYLVTNSLFLWYLIRERGKVKGD